MENNFVINDADFGKIKNLYLEEESIKQFIENVVYKHPNSRILLQNLSDIHVLVANIGSEKYLKNDEKSWKDIMNNEQYDILKKNNSLVIAYMLVIEKYENIHYIDLFDTVIRKNNLGFHIINKYKKIYDVNLIPQDIIETSAKYWAKILDFIDDKNIVRENLIEEYIENFNIKDEDISWKYLYQLCDIDEDYDEELKDI